MGLAGLISTALSAMVGVGINIIPFMIQRSQPGVGPYVPLAFLIAAVPATLAALCYAILASAMPRAGGSYVYATRALDPVAGFAGSFAQWFGLSAGMGVVAYLMVPMLRDIAITAGWTSVGPWFDAGMVRVPLALASIWLSWWVNVRGIRTYERIIIFMTVAGIVGPIVMTVVGAVATPQDFATVIANRQLNAPPDVPVPPVSLRAFTGACVVLFSSFIGFDAVSQAGGEARNPSRDLPLAIVLAIAVVAFYYVSFTASVYHAVPWQYIYRTALVQDVSAPALMAPLMSPWLVIIVLLAVLMAILDSIPSVMLANSRMLYAFSADRVFPAVLSRVHPTYRTPHHAITVTAICGSLSVLGCQLARDFFLGVDLLIVSMLVNFLLMAATVVTFPRVNPALYKQARFLGSRRLQLWIACGALVSLGTLLVLQVAGDLASDAPWYLKSTTSWTVVMVAAGVIFARRWRALIGQGIDPRSTIFAGLPDE